MSMYSSNTLGRSVAKAAFGVAILGGLTFGGASTVGAVPTGGTIQVYVTPDNSGGGPIVITGAIGDFGKTQTINQNGSPNPNGNFVKLTLKKGTIEVNITTLNAVANKMQPTVNAMTCSGSLSVTEPVTLFNGTGLYKGIAGTVHLTESVAFILPLGAKKGQCNESNAAHPLAQYTAIIGTGTVHFS